MINFSDKFGNTLEIGDIILAVLYYPKQFKNSKIGLRIGIMENFFEHRFNGKKIVIKGSLNAYYPQNCIKLNGIK